MAASGNRAGKGIWRIAALAAAGLMLAGCEEGAAPFGGGAGSSEPTEAASVGSTRLVDRDVEAPEVFQVTGQGLWDGRPSLGGVWVATPDAKDPERVLIRNEANGKFVIGALFRRERENPGPAIQISSDAAEALGMLAGQPASVNVTALRREEEPVTAPDATQPILDEAETIAEETGQPLDTAAVAAAIDEADGVATPVIADAAITDGAVVAAEEIIEPPKRKWWQRKPKDAPVVEEAVVVETEIGGDGAATAAAEVIAAAPLDAPVTAEVAVAAAPVTAAPGKSLIQLGIFSVEANAQRAADMVVKAGSPATVRQEQSNGKTYWSVVAGPAATPAEREALMAKVKGLGFADAYFVSR